MEHSKWKGVENQNKLSLRLRTHTLLSFALGQYWYLNSTNDEKRKRKLRKKEKGKVCGNYEKKEKSARKILRVSGQKKMLPLVAKKMKKRGERNNASSIQQIERKLCWK